MNNNISNEDSVKIHQEWENQFFGEKTPPKIVFRTPSPKKIIKPSFWKMALAYFKFELSAIRHGTVSSKVFEKRKKECLKCEGRIRDITDPIGYCNKCGCSKNPRSKLSVKLTVTGAECPLGKWKKEKGRISLNNIPKVAIGICVTVWYNVSRLWKRN